MPRGQGGLLTFQIENRNNQKTYRQYDHEFLICTHKHHPPVKAQDRWQARPPAASRNPEDFSITVYHSVHYYSTYFSILSIFLHFLVSNTAIPKDSGAIIISI